MTVLEPVPALIAARRWLLVSFGLLAVCQPVLSQSPNSDGAQLVHPTTNRASGASQTNGDGAHVALAGYATDGLRLTPPDGGIARIEPLGVDNVPPVATVDTLVTNDNTPALPGKLCNGYHYRTKTRNTSTTQVVAKTEASR